MAEVTDTIGPVYHNLDLGFDTEDIKRVSIKQDSEKTHILSIKIYTEDDQMELNPDWNYHITERKPDGKLVVDTTNIEVIDNVIYVTCTAQMLSTPGTCKCELIVYNNDQSLYSNNFYIYVEEDLISGDEIISTNEFNSLVKILKSIQNYETVAQNAAENAQTAENNASASANNASNYEEQILDILNSLTSYQTQAQDIIEDITSKSTDFNELMESLYNSADEINALILQLKSTGVDEINQILANVKSAQDSIIDIQSEIIETHEEVQTTATEINSIQADLIGKMESVNSQYEQFQSKMSVIDDKMNTLNGYLDNIDILEQQITDVANNVKNANMQAQADASAISSAREEIEAYLEQLAELVEEGGYDPIIVSNTQPSAEAQEKDDMWLQEYE